MDLKSTYYLAVDDKKKPTMLVRIRQNGEAYIERLRKGKWISDNGALEDVISKGGNTITETEALKVKL